MSGAVASFYFRIVLCHYAFPSGAQLLIFDLCQCRADGSEGNNEAVGDTVKDQGKRGKITEYTRFLIHIPSAMAKDSQFPFKAGQELAITVDPKGKIGLTD